MKLNRWRIDARWRSDYLLLEMDANLSVAKQGWAGVLLMVMVMVVA